MQNIDSDIEERPSVQPSTELTTQKWLSLGVFRPSEVDRICYEDKKTQFLIESFLPAKSIAIAAGESTIGKSPLMYQLGLCVASGAPFLGLRTTQGRVLYFDLENAINDSKGMRDALVGFLGLKEAPDDFLLVTEPLNELEHLISEVRPDLVIIDSLRAFAPEATEKNRATADWLNVIRKLARQYGVSFLIIHHLRKPKENSLRDLESSSVVTFMLEMEGPRALVNQTDVRIAVCAGNFNPAALEIKWSRRVHGDSPRSLLERVFDGDGEPVGYKQLRGVALLSAERRAALEKLPSEFRFKEAQFALDRSADPTNKFLIECKQLGLVEKLAWGGYRKLTSVASEHPAIPATQ